MRFYINELAQARFFIYIQICLMSASGQFEPLTWPHSMSAFNYQIIIILTT